MRLFTLLLGAIFAIIAAGADLDMLLMNTALFAVDPTAEPSAAPTLRPTKMPTAFPTTAEPTYQPTATPTVAPTAINLIKMEAKQTISGVSAEDYIANKDAMDGVFRVAIASTMAGVEPENIIDIGLDGPQGRRLAEGDQMRLKYIVMAHIDGETYENLVAQLVAACESTVLNDLIVLYATTMGVPLLADATVEPPQTKNLLESRGSSELLTGPQIAGLIIGIFMCLGLIAVVVAFIRQMHNSDATGGTNVAAPPDVSKDVSSPESTALEVTNQV